MREYRVFLIVTFLFLQNFVFAQQLIINFIDFNKPYHKKIDKFANKDSLQRIILLDKTIAEFYGKGYLEASFDSIFSDSTHIEVYGRLGRQYKWTIFKPDSTTNKMLIDFGIHSPSFNGKLINPKQLEKYMDYILKKLEDDGYPFSRTSLYNTKISENSIETFLHVDKGNRIAIDTIYLKGDLKLSSKKLTAIIDIKTGDWYSEYKVNRIDRILSQQAYISQIRSTEVEFLSRSARIYCYLNGKNASRFSGLAGFYTDKNDGKIKLNGNLNLSLVNTMKKAEVFSFKWDAPGKGTQSLKIENEWPYLLGSQIGIIGAFALYKQDSTYISINPRLAFTFTSSSFGRIHVNIDYKQSSVSTITTSTQSYSNHLTLAYGIGYDYNSLDRIDFPFEGFFIRSNLSAGTRKLDKPNSSSSNIIEGELEVKNFIPLLQKKIILAIQETSRLKSFFNSNNSNSFFENELYKIGGIGTIRGFNQESILASAFGILAVEIHYRLSEGSGFYLFSEKGYVKTINQGLKSDEWPFSSGVGLSLMTRAGLFNLSYALGKGFGQSFTLKDAKIHFGISNYF